jgi:ATP-dependent RNA helicase RhlE
MDFQQFNLHPNVAAGATSAGYVTPTPIQMQAIPPILQGRDAMGLAQTGTGKTAAFVLPILHRLMKGKGRRVRALIVAPTRELAEQIHEAIATLGRHTHLRSTPIYGGVGMQPQVQKLRRGTDIVVACPGRLLDHIRQRTIDLAHLEVLVLDEADHMFDMGFLPDIRRIVCSLPEARQTLLFSATMPDEIRHLAHDSLTQPVTLQVARAVPAERISHALYPVAQHRKTDLLLELLHGTDTGSVLIFTRTKHRAKRLGEHLVKAGHRATSLQGNLSQARRRAAMEGFRRGTFQILVATDIAARGIDVTQISHVINYDIPNTTDAYIHRIGRTGRAARSGDAYTLVTDEDGAVVRAIERAMGQSIERCTIPDFDYGAPAPMQGSTMAHPPPPHPGRRKPRPAAKPGKKKGAAHSRKGASPKGSVVEMGYQSRHRKPGSAKDRSPASTS